MKVEFFVNGRAVSLDVSPKRRLLDVLREDLGLRGTKEGCGKGECGACTVIMNGRRVNACLVPALQLCGARITTIEGLQKWPPYQSVLRAFVEHGAVQCGFCIPGFVVSAIAFLREASPPYTRESITWSLSGNICRCTGYEKILAVLEDLGRQPDFLRQINSMLESENAGLL